MAISSFLVDFEIVTLGEEGRSLVRPLQHPDVQPASVDLRLSGTRFEYDGTPYRLGEKIEDSGIHKTEYAEFDLLPSESAYLGLTGEIDIPIDSIGFIFARSSMTRLGLIVQPIFMNPGYTGTIPITLTNHSGRPVTIVKDIRVAQLVCYRLAVAPHNNYASVGKYAGERVSPSLLHTDSDIKAALDRVVARYSLNA